LIIFCLCLIIAKQPDLGTALLVAVLGVFVSIPCRTLGMAAILLGAARWHYRGLACYWQFYLHGYQRQRVLLF